MTVVPAVIHAAAGVKREFVLGTLVDTDANRYRVAAGHINDRTVIIVTSGEKLMKRLREARIGPETA